MVEHIKILVADSDTSVCDVLTLTMTEDGLVCDCVQDGISAIKLLRRNSYSLLVLEAELPDVDGLTVCRHLRKTSASPVIFVSRRANEKDRLSGFSVGGNDYVIKPFYPREMQARIRNLLNICGVMTGTPNLLSLGRLKIAVDSHSVLLGEKHLQLTPKEYDLLLFFVRHPGQAYSRDRLLDLVWGEDFFGSDRTVDTHIKSLRSRITPFQRCIETVWGFGYRFDPTVFPEI